METHKGIYLSGTTVDEAKGYKLPSYWQVFRYFLYLHCERKMTVRKTSRKSVLAAMSFVLKERWHSNQDRATLRYQLEKGFEEWKRVKNHAPRTSDSRKTKEKNSLNVSLNARMDGEWPFMSKLCVSTQLTATKTCHLRGTCVLLEEKLGRGLLYCECRHHELELVLQAAFASSSMGSQSTGPKILLFKRFSDD